jgi:SAM-dependent methyltransferase
MHYYLYEDNYVLKLITKRQARILDVGCGQGRYLEPLSKSHHVVGVDINKKTVAGLTGKGLRAFHIDALSEITMNFDYIIMSHFIEHLLPIEMLDTVDNYLDLLVDDGELIIATPLLYNEFYDDFDHVKPYTSKAIAMLFSDFPQHQKKPRNRLELRTVWIRKWPYQLFSFPGDHIILRGIRCILNIVMWFIFLVSFKTIARSTGWVGVFRKLPAS